MLSLFRSPRTLSLVIAIFLTTLIFLAGIWFSQVRTLYCFIEYANCPPEVTAELQSLKGQRLLISNLEANVTSRLISNPTLRFKTLRKEFPGTVVVNLESQKIIFGFKAVDSGAYILITDQGRTMMSELHPDWPVFLVSQKLLEETNQRQNLSSNTQLQLEAVLVALQAPTWSNSSLYLADWETVEVELSTGVILLFNLGQLPTQIERASEILSQLPLETAVKTKEIDLRFKLPVLRETPTRSRQQSQ